GTMPIQQIAAMIKSSGLKMIAEINVLEDNNRYGEYRDGSYHMLDGSTWLDSAADKGGKPWLSPFEDDTKEFVRYLTNEAASAGFDYIVISGLTFPDFRNSDLNYLGDTVKDTNRYKSLIELAEIAKTAANENNTDLFIRINAADAVYGKCEVLKPAELKDHTLLIDFDPTAITESIVFNNNEIAVNELSASDKFKVIFGIIKERCGSDISIIPVITENGLNHADYDSLIAEIISEGFESYSVK
ncbi:MAG: putative glycoside hydrolase, partial [Oscillospiraceae bacterium]